MHPHDLVPYNRGVLPGKRQHSIQYDCADDVPLQTRTAEEINYEDKPIWQVVVFRLPRPRLRPGHRPGLIWPQYPERMRWFELNKIGTCTQIISGHIHPIIYHFF
jgi:hypothetical protein